MEVNLVDSNRVLIGISTMEFARRADFYDYLNMVEKPVGTGVTAVHGQSPARARNLIIQQALENDFTHILFVDDDCFLPKDIISRLIKHDVDIVTGLYLMRNYPHKPIIFDYADELGRCRNQFLLDGLTGLVPIVACGLGACLIKTDVFKRIKYAGLLENGVANVDCHVTLGELEPDQWCDDIALFHRARKAGCKLYVDLDCPVGHVTSATVWPIYKDGKWYTTYHTNGTGQVTVPTVIPEEYLVKQ